MSFFNRRKKGPPEKSQIAGALGAPVYDGGLYSHVNGQVITPGAETWAFVQRFDKPQYDLIGGGIDVLTKNFACPWQEPQVYANLNAFNNGIGGIQAGQMVALGLVNGDLTPIE
jgi:hypothetical protein